MNEGERRRRKAVLGGKAQQLQGWLGREKSRLAIGDQVEPPGKKERDGERGEDRGARLCTPPPSLKVRKFKCTNTYKKVKGTEKKREGGYHDKREEVLTGERNKETKKKVHFRYVPLFFSSKNIFVPHHFKIQHLNP